MQADVLAELRTSVGFAWYAWVLTDPGTCVGVSPLAEVPRLVDLPRLIRLKYLADLNRWTNLPPDTCQSLFVATGGTLSASGWWREALAAYDVVDVVSMVHRDRFGCWGFLDLWRTGGAGPFTDSERRYLDATLPLVPEGIRRSHLLHHAESGNGSWQTADARVGPAILVFTDDLRECARTPAADAALRSLLPTETDASPVPAAAPNVAAQLLAVEAGADEHPASARIRVRDIGDLTLTAARLVDEGEPRRTSIAVSIQPSTPAEQLDLFVRAAGLTPREAELVGHLTYGGDSRELARRMGIGEHTVQDHLKAIFTKSGAASRRDLIARVSGHAKA